MVTIYNSDLSKELRYGTKAQISRDNLPTQLADKVVPVMEVNPKLLRIIDLVETGTSGVSAQTVNVTTANPIKDIYINSVSFSIFKDAACDSATGSFALTITLNGAAKTIASIPMITLSSQNNNITLNFPIPVKIDKNTTVRYSVPTFAAGVCRTTATVTGYYEENSNA